MNIFHVRARSNSLVITFLGQSKFSLPFANENLSLSQWLCTLSIFFLFLGLFFWQNCFFDKKGEVKGLLSGRVFLIYPTNKSTRNFSLVAEAKVALAARHWPACSLHQKQDFKIDIAAVMRAVKNFKEKKKKKSPNLVCSSTLCATKSRFSCEISIHQAYALENYGFSINHFQKWIYSIRICLM